MQLPSTDTVVTVPAGSKPDYNERNPVWRVVDAVERMTLAADREFYVAGSLQHLVSFSHLTLHGPSGDQAGVTDARQQDNKNDFQKQNIIDFRLGDTQLTRGYVKVAGMTFPFLRVSYEIARGSPLAGPGRYTHDRVKVYLKVGPHGLAAPLEAPYNEQSHRYELELWGSPLPDVAAMLGARGARALERGELLVIPEVIRGTLDDFEGPAFHQQREQAMRAGSALTLWERAPDHAMHPLRPLGVEIAWGAADGSVWDSNNGANHRFEFNMPFRGWRNYLGVGVSANPHGGVGFLEFRNLFSNYFDHESKRRAGLGEQALPELGRDPAPWSFDADWLDVPGASRRAPDQRKGGGRRESFMAVDYMDLHILKPGCCIGIHRHRDNQEVFMLLQGRGLMLVGDWCEFPGRRRAFELRTMVAGDMTICKPGRLHALLNPTDEDVSLLMFGGYD